MQRAGIASVSISDSRAARLGVAIKRCQGPPVAVILQLSDLHLLDDPDEQTSIFEALVAAVGKASLHFGRSPDLLAVTGDVFESVSLPPRRAIPAFQELQRRILEKIGRSIPTVVVPGNHDRRRQGFIGPHRDDLFDHLAEAADAGTFVHGTKTPFLCSVVPNRFHQQPFWLVAYDSTFLPAGLLGAGGVLRQEDLLHAASQIDGEHPDWPVVFLMHHHLVPTPLTDVGQIDPSSTPAVVQWSAKHILPRLIANADREELTMTALGAGTAISTLHSLGRATLVLHGHKHYATVRLLKAIKDHQGDVMLVSAGSCGNAQQWNDSSERDVARLWPSFNFIEFDETETKVSMVSFGWKGTSAGSVVFRPLVHAHREGRHWTLRSLPKIEQEVGGPILERNLSSFSIVSSEGFDGRRWDLRCHRSVQPKQGGRPSRYLETVEGPAQSQLFQEGDVPKTPPVPLSMSLSQPTQYELRGGLPRTLQEAERLEGHRYSPFVSVSLMNRYRAERAELELRGLEPGTDAFASETDLGTGLERPISIQQEDGVARVVRPDCPARALLRIYWPLRR